MATQDPFDELSPERQFAVPPDDEIADASLVAADGPDLERLGEWDDTRSALHGYGTVSGLNVTADEPATGSTLDMSAEQLKAAIEQRMGNWEQLDDEQQAQLLERLGAIDPEAAELLSRQIFDMWPKSIVGDAPTTESSVTVSQSGWPSKIEIGHLGDDAPTTTELEWDQITDQPTEPEAVFTDDNLLKFTGIDDPTDAGAPTESASKVSGPAPKADHAELFMEPTFEELEDVRDDPALADDVTRLSADVTRTDVNQVFEANDEPIATPSEPDVATVGDPSTPSDLAGMGEVAALDPTAAVEEPVDVTVDVTVDLGGPVDQVALEPDPGPDDTGDEEPFDVGD